MILIIIIIIIIILLLLLLLYHNEEIHSLYCLPNTVRVIKSRKLRWAGHVARMEEGRGAFKILTGTPAKRDRKSVV